MNLYYSMAQAENEASIQIYGDITSFPWLESDVSSYLLSKQISEIDASVIHVHINSYGGEVGEALAIYNALKAHKAKIITYADGFACSSAANIFAAGDRRIARPLSMIMVHHAWMTASGNSRELHKAANDLDAVSKTAMGAIAGVVNISAEELQTMLDAETWLTPQQALEIGLATDISAPDAPVAPTMSAQKQIYNRVFGKREPDKKTEIPEAKTEPEAQTELEKPENQPAAQENKLMKMLSATLCGERNIRNEE